MLPRLLLFDGDRIGEFTLEVGFVGLLQSSKPEQDLKSVVEEVGGRLLLEFATPLIGNVGCCISEESSDVGLVGL